MALLNMIDIKGGTVTNGLKRREIHSTNFVKIT